MAFLPDVYQSAATVLIERQQIPDDLVRSTVTSALETRIDTISQEILSRSHLQELIGRFGLYQDLKGRMERAVDDVRVRERAAVEGPGWAATWSWDRTAAGLLDACLAAAAH